MTSQPSARDQRNRSRRCRGVAALAAMGIAAGLVLPGTSAAAAAPVPPSSTRGHRVDLAKPKFTNPTRITNPLFPVSRVTSIVLLGNSADGPTRFEITRLPQRRAITWNGQHISTAVSQFVAFTNGRIHEVAIDYFAQADDGSVWYLGEDVANYENGVVVNHDGTWLAGRDGPGGMIMPANPKVGDVFHSENIPGLVFEEDTVTATNLTVHTPSGPVSGAIRIREVLMDGTREDKVYAPGYGQLTAVDLDKPGSETLAVAVPTDTRPGGIPDELNAVTDQAETVFERAATRDWPRLSATVAGMRRDWNEYRARGVPALLEGQEKEALTSLSNQVDARNVAEVRQASLAVIQATLDVQLRHDQPAHVDLDRMEAWAQRVLADVDARDKAAVAGDTAILEATWIRVRHTVEGSEAKRVDEQLRRLRTAADQNRLGQAAEAAKQLHTLLDEL